MCKRNGGTSIDAPYQDFVQLAKRFTREDFFKSTNQMLELPFDGHVY
jgi:hypothetical protein